MEKNINDDMCADIVRGALTAHGFDSVEIVERYNPGSPRIICKARADGDVLIVKCIPDSVDEKIIVGNTSAHRFLGKRGLAPTLIRFPDGGDYVREHGFWVYMFGFIDGEILSESPEDEYALGVLARRLHSTDGYTLPSWFDGDTAPYRGKYRDKPWAADYDRILDSLPDFRTLEQCFFHSDIGPHNAMRDRDGNVYFIDLDDSGLGSRWLDAGYPFIAQYVTERDGDGGSYGYNFDAALAFLRGYYGGEPIPRDEYDLLWHGAVFMQISYLEVFGVDKVDDMWRILCFGQSQKEALWGRIEGERRI